MKPSLFSIPFLVHGPRTWIQSQTELVLASIKTTMTFSIIIRKWIWTLLDKLTLLSQSKLQLLTMKTIFTREFEIEKHFLKSFLAFVKFNC